jgi:hypothetical protein
MGARTMKPLSPFFTNQPKHENPRGELVGSFAEKLEHVPPLLWSLSEEEGAGPAEANAQARGADGVEGLGSAPPQHLLHSSRAARDLERKQRGVPGLLLGPAARSP